MSQSTGSAKPCACRKITGCQAQAAGRLFLWFPVPHTLAKGIAYLKQEKLEYQLMQERSGLNVICQSGQAKDIACGIAHLLAPMEISETRVLFNRGKAQPQLHDFSDITSLQRFLKLSESDWLVNMLAEERFVNHFQPIVSIQDTTQIYGYESLIRGVDEQGNLVMPESILTAATEAGLLAQLDRIARLRAIAQASQHQLMGRLFINFTPTALYDPVSCLRSTVEAIDAVGISKAELVTTTPTFALNPPIINLTEPTKAQPGVHHQSESERIIAAVNQRIQESLELDEILQTTADEVRQLFNADRVVIYQFEDDWSGRVAVESLAAGCTSILDCHARDTCFQSTHATYYQEGNSRAIADMEVAELSPCYVELLRSLQIRASLIVPILHQDNLWGLLIAHQCYEARHWQQSEINLFNQLAGQAAIAIHQSELYQQLRQANQELQRLATSPAFPPY